MSRIWFITGASRGIGAEIAKAALAAGDKVVATGRDREKVARAFADAGDRVLPLALDVTQEQLVQAAIDAAVARFGRIDVLVNNAGYGQLGLFEENEPGDVERQFATNVFGLFHITRAVLPVMRQQRAGHIFNVTSVAGLIGSPGASIYCASKFAVEGFSEALAKEVVQFGIKITLIEPGPFRTDFLDGSSVRLGARKVDDYGAFADQAKAAYLDRNGKQPGDPAKLAKAVMVLAATEHPPLRYLAGSDGLGRFDSKLAAMRSELDQWRKLTLSTDYAAQTAAE